MVVVPYDPHGVRSGSQNWLASRWVWVSIHPGATLTAPVDLHLSPTGDRADRHDAAVVDSHIAFERRTAGSVYDGGPSDDQRMLGGAHGIAR